MVGEEAQVGPEFDKVKSAGREHAPFVIRAVRDGQTVELKARAVIDSTGTWNTPNPSWGIVCPSLSVSSGVVIGVITSLSGLADGIATCAELP